jgi:DNA polymerase-3 subunit epsilon
MMSRGQGARGGCVPVAHGAEFDRRWLPRLQGQWLCTYEDAIWPRVPGETGSLTAIALAYDVGIIRAHRAIEDCLTLAAVLSRVHEIEGGLRLWYERAMEPRQELIACVSYNDRQLAKDAGFRWDGDRKVWWKQVRQSVLVDFAGELPFDVRDGP